MLAVVGKCGSTRRAMFLLRCLGRSLKLLRRVALPA